MTDIVPLGCSLILLHWMFNSTCLYFNEYDIRKFLFVFWLRNRSFIKYLRNWGNGRSGRSHKKVYRCLHGERGITSHVCVRTYTISFIFLPYGVLFYLKKFNLHTLTFNLHGSVSVVISFFYFKLFFLTKVSQNVFNFKQIES